MLLLLAYFFLFFLSALIYIVLKSYLAEFERIFGIKRLFFKYTDVLMIFKALPLVMAIIFSYFLKKQTSDVYIGIALALIFCFLGDFFIDRNLIQGMLFFAMAHVFLIISFLYSLSLHIGILQTESFLLLILLTLLIFIYDYMFVRYLTMIKMPKKYNTPIAIYSILISTMFASSMWLAFISGIGELIILPLGAFLFLISDSMIAIREFRPKQISFSVTKIMGTYYLAIFLISLSIIYI